MTNDPHEVHGDPITGTSDLREYWEQLTTVALLGTDRRDPPPPPGAIADLVADAQLRGPAERALAAVAATTAVRRAGLVPAPPVPPPAVATSQRTRWVGGGAVGAARVAMSSWPVLIDEWLLAVLDSGRVLPPDLFVELLVHARRDPTRAARVALVAGTWGRDVVEHVPELAPRSSTVPAEQVTSLPDLPMPPELRELVDVDVVTFVARIVPPLDSGAWSAAHRAPLVHLMARCRPAVLHDAVTALRGVDPGSRSATLAWTLAEVAELRGELLASLTP